MSKRRGRITLSFEDNDAGDDAEGNGALAFPASLKPARGAVSRVGANNAEHASTSDSRARSVFDASKVRDRVMQMDLEEGAILAGEEAESLLEDGDAMEGDESLAMLTQTRIQEAKDARKTASATRGDFVSLHGDEDEELLLHDDEPMTRGRYWAQRDAREVEEEFDTMAHSRLVREDLLHDADDASLEGFTAFVRTAGARQGIAMTRDMLRRDVTDPVIETAALSDEDEESLRWQQQQVRKGMDKGWRPSDALHDKEAAFAARHAKLEPFVPPRTIPSLSLDALIATLDCETLVKEAEQVQENVQRIIADSKRQEETMRTCKETEAAAQEADGFYADTESFFRRLSRVLGEKLPELEALEARLQAVSSAGTDPITRDIWEHFFDDVDSDDICDLPGIIDRFAAMQARYPKDYIQAHLEESLPLAISLFFRHHFAVFDPATDTIEEVMNRSGLIHVLFRLSQSCIERIFKDRDPQFQQNLRDFLLRVGCKQ